MASTPPVIPPDVLDLPVVGRHLSGGRFGDQLGPELTLLSFLRHFG